MAQAPLTVNIKDAYKDGISFYRDATSTDFTNYIDIYYLGIPYQYSQQTDLLFEVVSGLPDGYSLTGSTGHFTGGTISPDGDRTTLETSESAVPGTYNLTVKVYYRTVFNYSGTNQYKTIASAFFTLKIVVLDDPIVVIPPNVQSVIKNEDISISNNQNVTIGLIAQGNLTVAQWRVTGLPPGLSVNYSNIVGTATVIGDFDVTLTLDYREGYQGPIFTETKIITITVDQGVPVVNLNGLGGNWNGETYVVSTSGKQGKAFNLQIAASNNPDTYAATGLPLGLTIGNSGLISGTPTTPGSYAVLLYATNATGTSLPATLRLDITEATVPTFLDNGGVDIFFDLQTRALSLTPPKAEATIASGSTVVNRLAVETLMIKTGETLWLNLRFTKGTTALDPEATGLRFGVAGKLGGSLLMEGDTFTKVGEGSGAYYRMRVESIASEFGAIIDDYYDDDAVEQISEAKENQSGASGEIEGLCEIVLTTGSGESIADIKSDTLGVTLKRSLFA